MIQINKGIEPIEWTRKKATPDFRQYEPLAELRDALTAEQGYICAYCMRRIPTIGDVNVDATSKIEHIKSRSERPDLQLDYANMAICCPGNLNDDAHCDNSKGHNSVSFNLHNQALQQSIIYDPKDGTIRSTNLDWNREMNEFLNLNHPMLKANRKEALWGVIQCLNNARKTNKALRNILNQWRQPNIEHKYYEFCGIIIWYFEKRLRE